MFGGKWGPELQRQKRPDTIKTVAELFSYLETLASDGRKFALGGDSPTLTDIHGTHPVHNHIMI